MGECVISVIIVNFNHKDDVSRCLKSLYEHLPEAKSEVLLVDNRSTDGAPELIAEEYPAVRLTRWNENRGLGPALHYLIAESKGEWLFILDSDTIIKAGCIDAILKFATANPKLGAVAPRLRDVTGAIQLTARRFPSPLNALFGRQTLLSKMWPGNSITRRFLKSEEQDGNQPFSCDWTAFAAVLVRRTALMEVGSVDPKFFCYWVDADFFRRLRKGGWEVWCYPAAEILHVEQNQPQRVRSPLGIRDFHRGALRYFYKHHGWGGLNPLLWVAAVSLWVRTQMQLLINWRRMRRERQA